MLAEALVSPKILRHKCAPTPATRPALHGGARDAPYQRPVSHPTARTRRDKEARLLAACCLADVMRIYAPDAPYDDDTVKVVASPAPRALVQSSLTCHRHRPRRRSAASS